MKRLLCVISLLGAVLSLRAQYDAAFTNYWVLGSYFNPAASGLNRHLVIQGVYSAQLTGFEHAPATMLATADLPLFFLSPRHGAGVGFMNDKVGLFSNKKLYLQYAYHHPLRHGSRLSAGLRVGMLGVRFDAGGLDVEDSNDPAFGMTQVDGFGLDVDLGLRYDIRDKGYVGLSVMHMTSPSVSLGDDKLRQMGVGRLYYLTAGYTLRLRNPQYAVQTSGILRSDLQALRGDLTARLCYDGARLHLYGGLSYSPTVSVALLLGTTFHGIRIGYSYEVYTGGIGMLNGTHELVLGYDMELNLGRKGKNKHQSIRIL